jgi:hypothetical protein
MPNRVQRLDRLRCRLRDWATDPTRVEHNRVLDLIGHVAGLVDADRDRRGAARPYTVAIDALTEIITNWDELSELLEVACDPPEEGEE